MSQTKFKKVVYVASPLRGDIENNIKYAQDFCRFTMQCGYTPYAPHLMFTQFLDDNIAEERGNSLQMGLEMLRRVDELWVFQENAEPSEGMKGEISAAQQLGLPINYFIKPENSPAYGYIPIAKLDPASALKSHELIDHTITHSTAAMFEYLPGFHSVLSKYGIDSTRTMIRRLERVKYFMYFISYCQNNCEEVYNLDYTYDHDTYKNFLDRLDIFKDSSGETDYYLLTEYVYLTVKSEALAAYLNNYKMLKEQFIYLETNPSIEAFSMIANNSSADLEWSDICPGKFYDEVNTPSIVQFILDALFKNESEDAFSLGKAYISVFDFGSYRIEFPDEMQRDIFVGEAFVDSGAALHIDGEYITEDYDF